MGKLKNALVPFLLFLASCAQVIAPDGGGADRTPPRPIAYLPDSAATNFTGKKIVIRFDEYIQLQGVVDQVVISPPMNNTPEITVRKKDVVVEFFDTLRPNTTYTINFGSAIRDITENNKLENFTYVFSTGPTIDTLRMGGQVRNAYTLGAEKNVLVMLYADLQDSAPLKNKPYYFSKTREDGSFRMTNLRAGKYRIFGLVDANFNYLYDNEEEKIAFADSVITLNGNIDTLSLRLFLPETKNVTIKKVTQPYPNRIVFELNKPDLEAEIQFSNTVPDDVKVRVEKSRGGDSISFFLNKVFTDTLRVKLIRNKEILDSTEVQLFNVSDKRFKARAGLLEMRKLQVTTNGNGAKPFDLGDTLQLYTNNPIVNFDATKVRLIRRNDTLPIQTSIDPTTLRRVFIPFNLEEDSAYTLYILPGAMIDWFGQKNDTLKKKFVVQRAGFYGNVTVKTQGLKTGKPVIIQLLGENGKVVATRKINADEKLIFNRLAPGMYSLRLIDDNNNDGDWDSGNYLAGLQPERVRFYMSPIKVRSGWDLDVEWKGL
ncbi:MAG: Ig-like domain-containing domain [Bacteroidia bacterium]